MKRKVKLSLSKLFSIGDVKADITFEPIENGSYKRRLFFFVNGS